MSVHKEIIHRDGSINTKSPAERIKVVELSFAVLKMHEISPEAFDDEDDFDDFSRAD